MIFSLLDPLIFKLISIFTNYAYIQSYCSLKCIVRYQLNGNEQRDDKIAISDSASHATAAHHAFCTMACYHS